MAPAVVVSSRRSIFTNMAELLGHIRALGTAVLVAAAISLCAEAHAKAPHLRRHKPLNEGLTSTEPSLPRQRPDAAPTRDTIGPPAPDRNKMRTLSEGLTST